MSSYTTDDSRVEKIGPVCWLVIDSDPEVTIEEHGQAWDILRWDSPCDPTRLNRRGHATLDEAITAHLGPRP